MGAGAIAMGSRFIASKESEFHEDYKNVVPPAKAQDTILVTGSLGPIRLWKNKYSLSRGLIVDKSEKMAEESKKTMEDTINELKKGEMAYKGNITNGAVLLGQSIGTINSIESVTNIIETIVKDAEKQIKNTSNLIK